MPRSVERLVEAVVAASGPGAAARPAAQLITLLENDPVRLPDLFHAAAHAAPARQQDGLWPALLLGVTGAPGSGKSTLVDTLVGEHLARFPQRRVGVIAVDPSSPFTGGAVLGDRVRMMRHATDPRVFIRSMASRGRLGGLALGVRGAIHVLALMGCDTVIVETVGVGQSEVDIASLADLVLLVLAPGQGDAVQLLKAGLMEIGDLFVVNKADLPGAAELHAQVLASLRLDAEARSGLVEPLHEGAAGDPPAAESLAFERISGGGGGGGRGGRVEPSVWLVSAQAKQGVPDVFDRIESLASEHAAVWRGLRSAAIEREVREAVLEQVRRRAEAAMAGDASLLGRVLRGEASVEALTQTLLERVSRDRTKTS